MQKTQESEVTASLPLYCPPRPAFLLLLLLTTSSFCSSSSSSFFSLACHRVQPVAGQLQRQSARDTRAGTTRRRAQRTTERKTNDKQGVVHEEPTGEASRHVTSCETSRTRFILFLHESLVDVIFLPLSPRSVPALAVLCALHL